MELLRIYSNSLAHWNPQSNFQNPVDFFGASWYNNIEEMKMSSMVMHEKLGFTIP
jgi:hypothetical protein